MVTLLMIWTMVAAGSSGREYRDWRVLAEFSSPATCEKAIADLGLGPEKARCIKR